ncbi:MAG: hypothetical protein F6K10_19330, partial [Moorea sp. SIO2B7]|nr:hypothetical protein [Moorena sp. SIO2B7]
GVQVTNTVDDSVSDLDVTGLFVAIGHRPNTDLFSGQLDMEDSGFSETLQGLGFWMVSVPLKYSPNSSESVIQMSYIHSFYSLF